MNTVISLLKEPIMFEAAVTKFVKEVGKDSLVAVPSLDEANLCRPFQVVVKKNRRWFWQSPKYEPSPFDMKQLLVDTETSDDVKVMSRELTTYNQTHTFSVKGKTGGKMVKLVDVELDGSDKISVEAKFGKISKLEVDQPSLMAHVAQCRLDVKHEFVEQVRVDPRKTLCVVVGSAQLEADGSVHMTINKEGEIKEEVNTPVIKPVDEEAEASVDDDSDQQLRVPANTPIAFSLCELLVHSDGSLELMVEEDSLGGFEDGADSVDAAPLEGILEGMSLEEQYGALKDSLTETERQDLSSSILTICSVPADVDTMLKLLKDAQRSIQPEPKVGELKVSNPSDAQVVLEKAGFSFQSNGMMTYPGAADSMLDALRSVFEALIELDDNSTVALTKVPRDKASAVLQMLKAAIHNTPMKTSDKYGSVIYGGEANPGRDFLDSLGFKPSDRGTVSTVYNNRAELEGAYRAVYALLCDKLEAEGGGFFSKCHIL